MEEKLATYLRERLPGAHDVFVTGLGRVVGGASRETWMFDAGWVSEAGPETASFVLRKDPPASDLVTDRALEFAFYSAFWDTGVPVPRMRWLERDPRLLGSPFFIMDRIEDCESSSVRLQDPDYRPIRDAIARQMYQILGEISRRDWHDTPIREFAEDVAPEDCWRAQLDYWEGVINENELSPQPITRAGIRWLRANPPPPPSRVSVVHGDFRVGNFLYRPEGIIAVVDWEMGHVGDPVEDLAWSFLENWDYFKDGRKGGIITAADAIKVFEEASGMTVDPVSLHWWDVFSSIKAQAIWQTAARSFDDGRTDELSMVAMAYGATTNQDDILLRVLGKES